MRYILLTAVALGLSGCGVYQASTTMTLPEGVTFVEEHKAAGNGPAIPYQKYTLDNGLTVILHPDKSDPLVHVDVTYHVGSAREVPGKSGFAHFFEHMMFQGSEHVGDQQHFKMVTESGGSVNGTTNRDRTNYYETVPANELEKMLWLESDRMGFLLNAVSQRKFEIQRDTVKNERAQNFDNRPYGLVQETLAATLYPPQHPYSWPTIGYVDDLNSVDVGDLKNFFLRWYGPNNATLTIGGDINVPQTLEWVEKYFGDIPKGPDVQKADKWPVTIDADRFVTIEDKIQQPMLVMSWPTEYPDAEARLSLDMLASVLGQGRNSLLYQDLVKPGKVLSASAYQDCGELACNFQLYVLGNQGEDLTDIRQDVMKVLDALKVRGIKQDDLEQVKGSAEAGAVFGLQSVHGKVAQLAANETFYGEPDRLDKWLKELDAVSTEDVEQAFDEYIWHKPSVNVSVVPLGKKLLEADVQNFTPVRAVRDEKAPQKTAMRETPETFDRSVVPSPNGAVTVKVPELYHSKLGNGIEITGAVSDETPTVAMHLIIPAGSLMEPQGKNGLASLTADLIAEGTTNQTSEQIAAELDRLGSSVSISASAKGTTVSVSSLTKNLRETLMIAGDMLFNPRFSQEDFDRLKAQTLEGIQFSHQTPQWQAGQARREVLYSDPWHVLPAEGTKETLNNLTLDDVKAFYANHYTPDKARLIVVGDVDKQTLLSKINGLNRWKGKVASSPEKAALKHYTKPQIWLVDKPGAPQSVVQMVRHAMPYDATGEMFKTQLANFNLAGNFNSRLNLNLREDKGYTYGAGGYVIGGDNSGRIVFQAQVRADSTVDTVKEMRKELSNMATNGITDDELAFLRLAVGQKDALSYETPGDKAGLIANIMRHDLPSDYKAQQKAIIEAVSSETLNALSQKWFMPDDYQVIIVGDATSLEPSLKALGLPVKRLLIEN
ncbi:insulinase family protein [Enterovibrio sp. ZSDZ35]|uniref:Insulinase family protein n=1 Tax=Enterovibrio qingdaonensis TaxID=2899818 RepID=A0ABT5QPR8_9GAMM|nr:pitrilysin family protein [Enterovibrio sp. ZSDZ35]MDD1782977.1 insulinase family protein [Enterovibrio sp. ZSDZ35]